MKAQLIHFANGMALECERGVMNNCLKARGTSEVGKAMDWEVETVIGIVESLTFGFGRIKYTDVYACNAYVMGTCVCMCLHYT